MQLKYSFLPAKISDIQDILELMTRTKFYFHPSKEEYITDIYKYWGARVYHVENHL